jgi:hypothetical protein
MTHTPGPWTTVLRDEEKSAGGRTFRQWEVRNAELNRCICDVYYVTEEGEADAILMAAAPDLLAALLQAEIVTAEACQGQDMANECWRILGQIRAAIAKAEGSRP